MTSDQPLVPVHLLELPVPLAAKTQQHFEELMREFTLIAADNEGHPDHHVPARLRALVDALVLEYGGITSDADERLAEAIDRGLPVIDDHLLTIPVEAAQASQHLGDLIDEADEYCRRGKHLLTLATPAELVAYRHWYLGQVVSQLGGAKPVPWPESPEALSLS